jgi:hypothetical protein
MKHRDNSSYGKRQEFQAIAKLLELNFDVYSTLVDDIGIDCIIRINSKRYLDIQIKARSIERCILKNRGFFPQLQINPARDNYFFILYSEHTNSYWVIPSLEIERMGNEGGYNISKMKTGNKVGTYSVRVTGNNGNPLPQFDKFKNEKGFKLLK